jgi:hypothetical protein
MAVGVDGDAHVGVTQDALDVLDGNAPGARNPR